MSVPSVRISGTFVALRHTVVSEPVVEDSQERGMGKLC